MNTFQDLKHELLSSNIRIQHDSDYKKLRETLLSITPNIEGALILDWTPEQAENIYWVMITQDDIAIIEIPRPASESSEVPIRLISHSEYSKMFRSRIHQRKFKVASELISHPGFCNH